MLKRLGAPSRAYALARTLLACAGALTMIVNGPHVLRAGAIPPSCGGARALGAFCLLGPQPARWVIVAVLLITASGWRPRVTAIPHWWAAAGIYWGLVVRDGGDEAAMVVAMLLIPIALRDPRKWQWSRATLPPSPWWSLLRFQIGVVYVTAAFAKSRAAPWIRGDAVYVYSARSSFRNATWLHHLASNQSIGKALSWSVIGLELVLAVAFLLDQRSRMKFVFPVALVFHLASAIAFRIPSMSVVMIACATITLSREDAAPRTVEHEPVLRPRPRGLPERLTVIAHPEERPQPHLARR